jgi:hypothetical protein
LASFTIDADAASAAMKLGAAATNEVTDNLAAANVEHVQRLLASKGMTLTLIPAVISEAVKNDRAAIAWSPSVITDKAVQTLSTIFAKVTEVSTARSASNARSTRPMPLPVAQGISLGDLAKTASVARLSLAVVSAQSAFANCAKVLPSIPGMRKPGQDAKFYDSLVQVSEPQDASGFRARPDLHIAALLDRMYFTGASMRIHFPDGEECDAYTSEDIGAAVSSLMYRVNREATAKELGLSLPMYDALATNPSGHRTSTLFAFLEKAGATVLATKSERSPGWATGDDLRPTQLRA